MTSLNAMYTFMDRHAKHYPRRDFQRSRVYKWERREHLTAHSSGEPEMTLEECEVLVAKHWRHYRSEFESPHIKPGRGCRDAHGSFMELVLPKWARRRVTVPHELAHAIATTRAQHGGAWVRVFFELLEVEGIRSFSDLATSARAAKIKIAPACACPGPKRARQTDEEKREQRRKWGKAYRDRKKAQGREDEE